MLAQASHKQYEVFVLLKGPVADATDLPQPWRLTVQPYEEGHEDHEDFSAFQF